MLAQLKIKPVEVTEKHALCMRSPLRACTKESRTVYSYNNKHKHNETRLSEYISKQNRNYNPESTCSNLGTVHGKIIYMTRYSKILNFSTCPDAYDYSMEIKLMDTRELIVYS